MIPVNAEATRAEITGIQIDMPIWAWEAAWASKVGIMFRVPRDRMNLGEPVNHGTRLPENSHPFR